MKKDNKILCLIKKVYDFIIDSRVGDLIRYKPFLPDKYYIRKLYKKRFGVYPNLTHPRNFNEKNNWRKLYDRQEIYTSMVDKIELKMLVDERCGEGHVFAQLGVWSRGRDINFDALPSKFVLKANHAGGVIVCRDVQNFDRRRAIRELNAVLRRSYYIRSREWPYKNVKRRIIAEAYMGENLTEYKNYCFNGKMLYTLVWANVSREDGRKPKAYFCGAYDRDWQKTDMAINYPSMEDEYVVSRPDGYEEMVRIAELMSKDIPFVRVDCYIIDGHVYVGEMTFFPWGGFQKFKSEKWNEYLGTLQVLPGIDDKAEGEES